METKILLIILIFIGIYIFFTKIIYYMLPFIIAWFLSVLIEPLVSFLKNFFRLPRWLSSLISLFCFIIVIIFLLQTIITNLVIQLNQLYEQISQNPEILKILEIKIIEKLDNITAIPIPTLTTIENRLDVFVNSLYSLLKTSVFYLLNTLKLIPHLFIFSLITVISTFFISKDRESIEKFINRQIPNSISEKINTIKKDIWSTFYGFLKAELIIISITFSISLIGLKLIGIKYYLVLAVIICFVDILPVLGTGTVLVPTSIWFILNQNILTGIKLLILYGIIVTTRQIIEPKLIGSRIGLHPLVTLIAMYVGLKIFGIIGILIGPLTAILFKEFQKMGIIPKWK